MKKKVLVVDSSNLVRFAISRSLADFNLEVEELNDIDELLKMPEEFCDNDLIILESSMEMVAGPTSLEKVKTSATLQHIPIVMLINPQSEDSIQRSLRDGAIGYIRKPFSEQDILSQVNYILGPSDRMSDLYATIRKEVNRAERGNYQFSLMGIHISDALEPVKQVSLVKRLKMNLREIDSICIDRRFGIVLVLPFTRAEKIASVGEKILKIVAQDGCPQTSFTCVNFPEDGLNEKTLMNAVEIRKS